MMSYFGAEKREAQLAKGDSGSYVNGEWIPDFEATTDIIIIVPQPIKANELSMLPDGEKLSDYLKTYTEVKVMPRLGNVDSDKIIYDSRNYKVVQVDNRSELGNFYKVIMRKLD